MEYFYIKYLKRNIKDYVKEQSFTNPNDVLATIKDMFKEVLQEALEAEMDMQLGYDKYNIPNKEISNSRNGFSKKTMKSELGPVQLNIPRDRNIPTKDYT